MSWKNLSFNLSQHGVLHLFVAICGLALIGPSHVRGTTVDVVVFYTQSVLEWHVDEDGVIALVQESIVKANTAFTNSEIDLELRLVGVEFTDLVENGSDFGVDLDRIAKRDGVADAILDKRVEVGADLVCLFGMYSTESQSGIAYILSSEEGNAATGFSVVDARVATTSNVFTHEIGHNLGAAHDRENAEIDGLYSYSYGYRFEISTGAQLRTLMAYSPGVRIEHFSNPDVLVDGKRTGVQAGAEGEADNARTLRSASAKVSGYFPSKPIAIKAFVAPEFYGEAEEGAEAGEVVLEGTTIFSAGVETTWHWTWTGGEAFGQSVTSEFPLGETPVHLTVTDALGGRGDYDSLAVVGIESQVTSVAYGERHELVLLANGALLGRGANDQGQLGLPRSDSEDRFRLLSRSVASVDAYGDTSVYVMDDGSVWGMGSQFVEKRKIASSSARKAVVGENHVLVQMLDGSLWGIGSNYRGAIGLVNQTEMVDELTQVVSGAVVDMSAGEYHSLFVREDGSLWGMGENRYIGISRPYNEVIREPTQVFDRGFESVSSYGTFSLAIGSDGSAWAAGSNYLGEHRSTFTKIVDEGIVDAFCAPTFGLLVDSDGNIRVLGRIRKGDRDSEVGQEKLSLPRVKSALGTREKISIVRDDGTLWDFPFEYDRRSTPEYYLEDGTLPVRVLGSLSLNSNEPPDAQAGPDLRAGDRDFDGWASLSLDASASSDDWAIVGWEWSWEGMFVEGKEITADFPVGSTRVTLRVTDHDGAFSEDEITVTVYSYEPSPIVQVESGWGGINLYRHENGLVSANGVNVRGLISPEDIGKRFHRPRVIWDGAPAVDVATGSEFCLILCEDGSLWGKGARSNGNLGPDAGQEEDTFDVQIFSSGIVDIAAGFFHSLCIKEDGSVWGFGSNGNGQLGLGSYEGGPDPRRIINSGAIQVDASLETSVVLMEDGSLMGFGLNNYSQLGRWEINFTSPKRLEFENAVQISCGFLHTVVVLKDGSAWRQGSSGRQRLGALYGLEWKDKFYSGVRDVCADGAQTLVLMRDGAVWGMGLNHLGSLGAGPGSDDSPPVVIHQGGVTAIAGGNGRSLFVREDGTIWGTGHDWDGNAQQSHELSRLLSGEVISPALELGNQKPSADFRLDPIQYKLSSWETASVELDGTYSGDDWQIASWEWSWGEEIQRGQKVLGSFPPGTHTISLRVRDSEGEDSEIAKTIRVINSDVFEEWANLHFTADQIQAMGDNMMSIDIDGDGLTNEEEWHLGLDPQDRTSRFWIYPKAKEGGQLNLVVPRVRKFADIALTLLSYSGGDQWEIVNARLDDFVDRSEFPGLSYGTLYKVKLEYE